VVIIAIPAYIMDRDLEKKINYLEGQVSVLVQEIKGINNKLKKHGIE
jgi:hypothetical protein